MSVFTHTPASLSVHAPGHQVSRVFTSVGRHGTGPTVSSTATSGSPAPVSSLFPLVSGASSICDRSRPAPSGDQLPAARTGGTRRDRRDSQSEWERFLRSGNRPPTTGMGRECRGRVLRGAWSPHDPSIALLCYRRYGLHYWTSLPSSVGTEEPTSLSPSP